jgi:hypothetical protein
MQGLAGNTCLGLQLLAGDIVTLIATALAPQEWVAYCSEGGPWVFSVLVGGTAITTGPRGHAVTGTTSP